MLHIGVVTVDVDSNHFGLNNMQNGQHEDIKKKYVINFIVFYFFQTYTKLYFLSQHTTFLNIF